MLVSVNSNGSAPIVTPQPKEMLSVRTEGDKTFVRINSSSLSLMQECWRKTEYALVRNLKSNLESPATLFGTAIHKALEVFYSGTHNERIIPQNFETIFHMIGQGQWENDWSEYLLFKAVKAFVEKAQPLKGLPDGNKRAIGTGVWILQHYFTTYINDPFVVFSTADGPIVEYKFTMPIYEDHKLKVETFGQIDVVLKNEATGVVLPCDHKTTSILGNQFYQRLNPNHQYTFYTWACNEVLNLRTESFLVNALQVKDMPKTSRGGPPQFARQVTTRTNEDFEDLRKTIVATVRTFLSHQAKEYWPMTTPGPCSSYNGCQFIEVCGSPNQLKENIIKAKYQEMK